ncbi:uncharacterized protein TRAVEDRAFT_53579 [Trametes versicolor FP-101664 SS1]|uniref:uncharacterized protein n=1 Tax=Trametes versicolor (strain FP-101664) TaxID=717944 RepID=UPI00046241EF|nr:uncharacterized protein TRAVEDRAFT_53579 [Trametes versicolor FP-101664 SS1]EIW52151.1 hypothetical protein TRAVEDRAFT_53579 [Trametes versicolor FP-101664 SS1]
MAPSPSDILGLPSFDSTFGAAFLGLVVGNIYHYLITEVFNVIGLLDAHWSVRTTVLTTGIMVFMSQIFYAHRVYHVPVGVFMCTGLSFGMAAGIQVYTDVRYVTDFEQFSWLVSVAYGFAVGSDVILTSALVLVLQRSRTGSKRSDTVLGILIKYTINTGLLTSVVSIFAFVFTIILPGNLIYPGVSIVGAKLLAVVNSRKSIGDKFFDDFTTEVGPGQSHFDIESMVWNVHQSTTAGTMESISTNQEMSVVANANDIATEYKPRRPNLTVTV